MKHIVKHGNNILRFTCRECRCVYECDKEDYAEAIERDDENKNEIIALHYYAICPECDLLNAITKTPPM